MRKYEHLRNKAVQLRKRRMSLTDICERLGMSKTTVWYWIKDIDVEIAKTHRQTRAQKIGSRSNKRKCAARRQQWYDEAMATAKSEGLTAELRDFVVMYMGEGHRRDRNTVEICNSNPTIMLMSHRVMCRESEKQRFDYSLKYHIDNDIGRLQGYWAKLLGINAEQIALGLKPNSNNLSKRQWACVHGVLHVRVGDTKFRMKLQAWMDYVTEQWGGKPAGPNFQTRHRLKSEWRDSNPRPRASRARTLPN